jgi:hypothetical protein
LTTFFFLKRIETTHHIWHWQQFSPSFANNGRGGRLQRIPNLVLNNIRLQRARWCVSVFFASLHFVILTC